MPDRYELMRKRRRLRPGADQAGREGQDSAPSKPNSRAQRRKRGTELGGLSTSADQPGRDLRLAGAAVNNDLVPDPAVDNIFPLHGPDPHDSRRPHPLYAAPSGWLTAPAVKVKSVQIAEYQSQYLRDLASEERAKPLKSRRLDLSDQEIQDSIPHLEKSVRKELERTMSGTPENSPAYYIRRVTRGDVKRHEAKLVGQHGLFINSRVRKQEMPTLENGKIIGLFSGAKLTSKNEFKLHFAAFGGERHVDRYALDVAKSGKAEAFTLSPMGAANSMAFANTALKRDMTYDDSRINAKFLPFIVNMQDKDGHIREEQVVAVIGLNNLRDQVLLDYGAHYLKQFKEDAADKRAGERAEAGLAGTKRRRESDVPENSSTAGRYKLRSRDRARER
jgi:hypothetical protein